MNDNVATITRSLSAPFEMTEVKFKPQAVKNNRAIALAYVDARAIQDRLDDVLGVEGWQDEYTTLEDGSVVCRLRLRIGGEWITKMDVGSPSEQPDGGDRLKAAFSDALKRAAVKFGVGRYLYRLPALWCDYDPVKKQFTRPPTLPAFAQPETRALNPQPKLAEEPKTPRSSLPANGLELFQRLRDFEDRLARQGLCTKGELVQHVTQEGVKAGHGPDLSSWTGPAILFAVERARAFEASVRRPKMEQKAVA